MHDDAVREPRTPGQGLQTCLRRNGSGPETLTTSDFRHCGNLIPVRPLTDDDQSSKGRVDDPGDSMMAETASARPLKDVPLDEARLRQQAIGVKLRQMFDDVVSESVPDDFLEILRRADERRAGK